MSKYNLKQALLNQGISEKEANEQIASFEEQVQELEEEDALMYEFENVFYENFSLELDYLEDYMNEREKK